MIRDSVKAGIASLPPFEGVPIDCPTEDTMRRTYRTLMWLADNYESPGSAEHEGLLEGARSLVTCAFDIYRVHLDAERDEERQRKSR
jgi:hypothetical protein